MAVIETERMVGRYFKRSDGKYLRYFAIDAEAMQLGLPDVVHDEASMQEREQRVLEHIDKFDFGFCLFFKKGRAEAMDSLLGFCGLFHRDMDDTSNAELGYWTAPNQYGKGYGYEMAKGALDWGRGYFDSPYKITANVHKPNVASVKILEKLGMLQVGEVEKDGCTFLDFEIII